jgi:hypothetical protein
MAQVAGSGVWLAGWKALLSGNLPGVPSADVFQLPGAFLIHRGKIMRAFCGETSAAKPDYCEMASLPSARPAV